MNTLLLEIIAAQAMAGGNPAVAEVLARMRSGSAADVDVQALLAQQVDGNPVMGALLKQLADAGATGGPPRDGTVIDVEPSDDSTSDPGPPGEPATETTLAELQVLRERSDMLAAALGACCLCWGETPDCRICRGRGRPGFARPDEDLLEQLVLPAVRMLRAQRTIRGGSPSGSHREAADAALRVKSNGNQTNGKQNKEGVGAYGNL